MWHVERDRRIWSCRKPLSVRLNRGHPWATTRFQKEAQCQRTVALPPAYPLFTSTPTCLIPGCLCGCPCTAPGFVQSSPVRTSKDACITFWKGRLAGNASCITSQCECFYFHNRPDPWGIQGHNCNSNILIKQGVNCACRALESSLQRTVNPVNFRKMLHRYHSTTGGPSRNIIGIFGLAIAH